MKTDYSLPTCFPIAAMALALSSDPNNPSQKTIRWNLPPVRQKLFRRNLIRMLSWLFASFAPFSAWAGLSSGPVKAQSDPPRSWQEWDESEIESITTDSEDQKSSIRGLLDGNPKTCTFFKKLEGSNITIRFKKAREVGRMAFLQGGYDNWALPRHLTITLDGDGANSLGVELQNARGKIQDFPLNRSVRQIGIHVGSIWREPGKTTMDFGGFSGIGQSTMSPAEWSLLEKPLQSHQTQLRLSIASPVSTQANLTAVIDERATYNYPPLDLKVGTHDYLVDLSNLTETEPHGLPVRPQHIDALLLASTNPEVTLKIENVTPLEIALPAASWEALPPIDFPTRIFEGETWREGLSHRTAGRFGNTLYNGLLTEVVGDSWFRAYTAHGEHLSRRQDFDFYADGQQMHNSEDEKAPWKLHKVNGIAEKVGVNWTTMKLDVKIEADTIRYIYGILAPGFLVDSPRSLSVSSRGGGSVPIRSGAPDEEEDRFQKLSSSSKTGGIPRVGPSAVLTSKGLLTKQQEINELDEPWFVGIWGIGDGKPTFWGDKAVAVLFSSDSRGSVEWTESGLRLPPGRWGVSTAFHGLINDGWNVDVLADRARLLTRLLRNYPVECRELYKVEADKVRILNEFSYERWGRPDWQASDYAPIPPICSWGRDSRGWSGIPTGVDVQGSGREIHTPFGPWRRQLGNTLTYELPRFLTPHAAFPRRPEFEETISKVEHEIHTAMTGEPNDKEAFRQYNNHPWNLAYYKRWSQGILGGSFLNEKVRGEILAVAKPQVIRMYEPSSWIPRRERFSGEPYYIRGWRDSRALPAMFGDPNSNVGQAAYSLYLYAKYSGNWDLVEELWPRVMDTLRIFEVLNDWAVPETSSREAIKYSSIDMDTIAFAGVAAMGRMAEVLGKSADAERIAYLQAKLAVATALRFNFARYLDPEKKFPRMFGVGFAEDGPSMESAKAGSTAGLDHIAMCLTWTGEMPEMYSFYFNALGADFMKKLEADFMETYFPDWRTMSTNTSRTAAHIAARCYLSDWPIDKINDDIDIWLKHTKRTYPSFESNGMIGAWSGHDTGVSLINWEPARFGSSTWDQSNQRLMVELSASTPFMLEFVTRAGIDSVQIDNGTPVSVADITTLSPTNAADPLSLRHQIRLPHGGKIDIRLKPAP